jgi:hypothetical protein
VQIRVEERLESMPMRAATQATMSLQGGAVQPMASRIPAQLLGLAGSLIVGVAEAVLLAG